MRPDTLLESCELTLKRFIGNTAEPKALDLRAPAVSL